MLLLLRYRRFLPPEPLTDSSQVGAEEEEEEAS